jgi:predicted nucleic acid-binding protein
MARLIDTSALITLERRRLPIDAVSQIVPAESGAIASITASELLAGIHQAQPSERRDRREASVETVLAILPVLPSDLRVARVHARVGADLLAIGQPMDSNDLLIAATALAHGLPILTENLRDFERVPGLTVQRPDW